MKKGISIVLFLALVVGIIPFYTVAADDIPTPDLVWYTFDDISGTNVPDHSGSSRNATLYNNYGTTEGMDGGALVLNANSGTKNGYAQLPAAVINGVTDFTISTWVRVDAMTSWARVFDFGRNTTYNMFFTASNADGGGEMVYAITRSGGSGEQKISFSTPFAVGKWTHIAITQSGQTVTFYIDGVAKHSQGGFTNTPSSVYNSSSTNYLGRSHYSADSYFQGAYDDFRMYGSALTEDQITDIMLLYAPEIVAITPVEVESELGALPKLPSTVNVTYADGTKADVTVIWDEVDEALMYSGLTYQVSGKVGGTKMQAKATVNVNSQSLNENFGVVTGIRSTRLGGLAVTGDYAVANYTSEAKGVYLIYTLHDLKGQLKKIVSQAKTIPANGRINETVNVEYPAGIDPSETRLSIYVWDNKLIPIAARTDYIYGPIVKGSRFADDEVKLLDAQEVTSEDIVNDMFYESQQVGEDFLLGLDVDKLAETLFVNAGLPSKLEAGETGYTGRWAGTSSQISGQNIGHYLSAAALMYNQTGSPVLKERIDYAVDQIVEAQDEYGFVGGFARTTFENNVFNRPTNFSVAAFSLGNLWVPWYSLHKIYRGLTDAYTLTGNELALDAVSKFTDWAITQTDKLNEAQFQRMLACEFGGMPECMAELYQITGDEKYLNMALRFCEHTFMDALANGDDPLTGKHANTQIPKIMGAARLYEITGDEYYYRVASNFWETVVNDRSYVTGGNSIGEHFSGLGSEALGVETTESCNTYNMMRLTEFLFSWNHDAKYAEYYENALYNHILGTQDPETGGKQYFVPFKQGHFRTYSNNHSSFWCCVGTGMENPARYHRMIYYKDREDLYVNLFVPSDVTWNEAGLKLRQINNFPIDDATKLMITEGSGYGRINVRVPEWVESDVIVTVNGKAYAAQKEAGYITIDRNWKTGDVVDVTLPMDLNLYTSRESTSILSTAKYSVFRYGPIVLAGALGTENMPASDIDEVHTTYNNWASIEVPTLVHNSKDPDDILTRVSDDDLTFVTSTIGRPGNVAMTLQPFYSIHHQRYNVYWTLLTEEEWAESGGKDESYATKLEAATIDSITPSLQQSEIEHDYVFAPSSDNSYTGYVEALNVFPGYGYWRDYRGIGSISYTMKVNPTAEKNYLMAVYWGGDGPFSHGGVSYTRQFNVLVGGTQLAEQIVSYNNPNNPYVVFYEIPKAVIDSAVDSKVVVKFESTAANRCVGGLLALRTTTAEVNP